MSAEATTIRVRLYWSAAAAARVVQTQQRRCRRSCWLQVLRSWGLRVRSWNLSRRVLQHLLWVHIRRHVRSAAPPALRLSASWPPHSLPRGVRRARHPAIVIGKTRVRIVVPLPRTIYRGALTRAPSCVL